MCLMCSRWQIICKTLCLIYIYAFNGHQNKQFKALAAKALVVSSWLARGQVLHLCSWSIQQSIVEGFTLPMRNLLAALRANAVKVEQRQAIPVHVVIIQLGLALCIRRLSWQQHKARGSGRPVDLSHQLNIHAQTHTHTYTHTHKKLFYWYWNKWQSTARATTNVPTKPKTKTCKTHNNKVP